jgi:hypothetical protein
MTAVKISTGMLLALIVAGIFLTFVTSGMLMASQTLSLSGTVSAVNVGVYSNYGCTQNCTSVNWGTISPGNSATYTVYVKNTGTVPVTLTLTTANWNPSSANGPIALSWNKESTVLNAGQSTSATMTLTVSSSISSSITDFSFNIIVTGTG